MVTLRDKAKRAGKKYYSSTVPCKLEHEPLRLVVNNKCAACETFRKARYRKANKGKIAYRRMMLYVRIYKATPKWANLQEIERIYNECPDGYTVDHIVPITSDVVCGLHVPCNLQYLTTSDNCRKSNKFSTVI